MREELIGHWIFTSGGIEKGCLRISEGRVEEVCWGTTPAEAEKALILPGLVNSHVHLGDSIAYPAPKGTVQELVGPPDGYKHRVLMARSASDKIASMRAASQSMAASGTTLFSDFREEGVGGVTALKSALEGVQVEMRVFGRPSSPDPDDSEIDSLVRECDGIGMSALSDWPYDLLTRLSSRARSAGKSFAVHASETKREDIDRILDLKPSFLVHMCSASDDDIAVCADAGVPIVVCPRSNTFFGLDPHIPKLLEAGVTVSLGTDNSMIARPDMIDELSAARKACSSSSKVSLTDLVNLATFNGRKVLNAMPKITTEITEESDLVAIQAGGDDPLLELVTGSRSNEVLGMAKGGEFRRTSGWTRSRES
jgi:cytosine/adenosine deaminase-related metal-dependent hydrolase